MADIATLLERCQSVPESGCLIWEGPLNGGGYGRAWFSGKECSVHRVLYEAVKGPIPKGLELDHKCRVRCCVNPLHLEAVTRKENAKRSPFYGAKTHCKRGHLLSGSNLRITVQGYRECKACKSKRLSNRVRDFK